MDRNVAVVLAMALSLSAFALPAVAKDAKGGSAVMIPASDLKWGDVAGFPGVKMAVLDGDPGKGSSHFMIKFTPGFSAPLHHHSSDHHVNVMAGTVVLTVDGKEHKLPAGSYFSFKGKKRHLTKCEAGAECLLSVDVRGKWDVVPEEKAGEKKK